MLNLQIMSALALHVDALEDVEIAIVDIGITVGTVTVVGIPSV